MEVGQKIKYILEEKGIKQSIYIKAMTGKEKVEAKDRTKFSRMLDGIQGFDISYLKSTGIFLDVDINKLLDNEENQNDISSLKKLNLVDPENLIPLIGSENYPVPYNRIDSSKGFEKIFYESKARATYALRIENSISLKSIMKNDICIFKQVQLDNIKDGDIVHFSYGIINKNNLAIYHCKDNSITLNLLNENLEELVISHKEFFNATKLIYLKRSFGE